MKVQSFHQQVQKVAFVFVSMAMGTFNSVRVRVFYGTVFYWYTNLPAMGQTDACSDPR